MYESDFKKSWRKWGEGVGYWWSMNWGFVGVLAFVIAFLGGTAYLVIRDEAKKSAVDAAHRKDLSLCLKGDIEACGRCAEQEGAGGACRQMILIKAKEK